MALTIEQQMAAALANTAGENVADVQERTAEKAVTKKSALANLMATATVAAEEKKVVRTQTAAGVGGRKRTAKVKLDPRLRDVIVLRAASVNLAYTLTNGFYTGLDEAATIKACLKYISNRKGIMPLLEATDLECFRTDALVDKDDAEELKSFAHDDLIASGFNVLSTKPKGYGTRPVVEDIVTTNDEDTVK